MANTTFSGPVRSENGFQSVDKSGTTGAYTTRVVLGYKDAKSQLVFAVK